MAAYSLGSLVVSLGADVKGLTGISSAMLKVQQDVLTSVNKIVDALDRIEKKGIRSSKNYTQAVVDDQNKIRKEYEKTAKTQEALANKRIAKKTTAPVSAAEVSNVVAEKQAIELLALRYKVSAATIKDAINQKIALINQNQKTVDSFNRSWDRAISENKKRTQQFTKDWNRALAENERRNKQAAATNAKLAQQATATATTKMNNMFQPFEKSAIASLSMVAQRLRTFGYLASATLTAPIVLAGKSIVKLASDFEYSMQKIVGLTGTAQNTVNEWADQIKLIGREFGKKPQELAEGLYYIASSGIKGAQALDVLKLSAKAAAAGLGDTQSVANYLTSVLNAYRGTGLTAAYATDVLVAAVREGKAEASGFASAMGSVTPIASLLGVSIDQVAGAMSAMTLTGSTAAQAATYLRGIFNGLMKESEGGAEAMQAASGAIEGMGTSYEELRNILQTGGVIALVKKLNDLSAVYGETLVSKVFPNIRAMTGILSLSGKNMQYNSEMMKRITESQGSLGKAFAAVADTIKVRYDRALVAANIALIELGKTVATAFLPILERWVSRLENLIKWFNNLDQSWKNLIMWVLKIAAVIGPLSMAFSLLGYIIVGVQNIINGFGAQIAKLLIRMGALKVATDGTTASVMLFGKTVKSNAGIFGALIRNPYVLIAAGAIAATVAIVALIRKHNEFNRVQRKVAGDTAIEAGTMQGLFNRAKDLTRSLEQRKKTIETINDKYGEYLRNLLTEKTSVEEIGKAYEEASKQLQINIALKMNQDALEANMRKTAKAFKNGLDDVLKVINEQKPDMLAEFYNDVYALTEEAIKKGKGRIDWAFLQSGKTKLVDKYLKGLEVSTRKMNVLVGQISTGVDKVAGKKVREFDFQNFVDTLTTKFDNLKKSVDGANEAMGKFKLPNIPLELPNEMPQLASDILGGISNLGKGQSMTLPFTKDLKVGLVDVEKILADTEKRTKTFFEGKGYQFGLNDDLDKLMYSTYASAKGFEYLDKIAKQQGFTFDKNTKLASLYDEVVDKLANTQFAATPLFSYFAREADKARKASAGVKEETKYLANELKQLQKVFDDLNSSLASNQMRKFIEPSFDETTANLNAYKQAYEDLIKEVTDTPIMPDLFKGGFDVFDMTKIIKIGDFAKTIDDIQKFYKEINRLTAEQEQQEDTTILNLLKAEANAYGTLGAKIEVVNYMLQAQEKAFKKALEGTKEKKGIDPLGDEAKRMAENINMLKGEIVSMQNALDFQWLYDMNNALNNASTNMELLSGRINAIQRRLEYLSEAGEGSSESFKLAATEMQKLITAQNAIDSLSGAFTQLFDAVIEGGQNMGEVLGNILKGILRDLAAAVARMLAIKLVMSILNPAAGAMKAGRIIGAVLGFGGMGFAQGGVVPQGYPNDTYPARLTSGETVLPAKKLDQYEFGKQSVAVVQGEVRFEIEDNKLVGILNKYNKKNTRY